MIKRNELREGNYYRCKNYNGSKDVILPFTWQEHKYVHLFEPIPLTYELLEEFGLVKNGFSQVELVLNPERRLYRALSVDLRQGMIFLREGKKEDRPDYKDDIVILWNRDYEPEYYLHQLQNLYNCLTGKELPIKKEGV